jgi:hypothetical protein
MGDVSAIFIQRGAPKGKQTDVCLAYTAANRLPMIAIVPYWAADEAVAMVKSGQVNTIITAFDSRAARHLADQVDGHGQVVYVHPEPGTIVPEPPRPPRRSAMPASVADLICRWHRAGRTASQIAHDLESKTSDVADVIRRADDGPGRSD